MKRVVGYSCFKNDMGTEFVNIHYTDDDNFPDFAGVSVGTICVAYDSLNFNRPDEELQLGDVIEIEPKISRKGKLYKVINVL